ncbi:MAG: hypothetical protein GF388_08520, partial [Candidatus Aegiribacteria sp.]|nr:hypothetical protein [Candidatus Aegiribacteria sp.]
MKRRTFLLFLLPAVLITYSAIFTSGRLPGGELSDTVSQGYPFFSYTAESIENGSIPHWNPYVFCGIPHFSSFGAPIFYPVRGLLLLATGVEGMVRFLFPIQMLLGGVFAWLFLGSIGVSRWGRTAGALAFAAGAWSNTLFYAGHGSKVICWSFLPLLLYSCEMWLQSGRWRFIALGAFSLGMQALSSHPQMILYSAGAAIIWSVFRTFSMKGTLKRNAVRSLGGLATIAILAVAVGAVQLLPGYNFSRYSNRAESLEPDQAASYSLPPEETLTMLFPHLYGYRHGFDDSTVSGVPLYFGRLGLRLSSEFIGIIPFILALAAFLGFTKKYRWPLLTIAGAGMLISWGGYTPLFELLYKVVPFFSKLRAPHMAAFLTTSALALAAGPGFDTLFVKKNRLQGKKFLYGILAFAVVCVLIFLLADALLPGLQSSWWRRMGNARVMGYSAVVNRRVQMASGDFLRAAAAALVLAGIYHFRHKWKKAAVPGIVLTLALAAETIPIDRDFQYYLPETSLEELYQGDGGLSGMVGQGRILPGSNRYIPYGIRSVEGYHGVKPQVSEDLRSTLSSGGAMALRQTAVTVFESGEGYLTYSQFRD